MDETQENQAVAALKAENDRREVLLAEQKLGGQTNAGQVKQEPKEDSPEEYVKKVMNGEIDDRDN
jgi:hypothetical protein